MLHKDYYRPPPPRRRVSSPRLLLLPGRSNMRLDTNFHLLGLHPLPYSLADLSVDFSALVRSDALSMTSKTSTEFLDEVTKEEGEAPAEAEEDIEESSSDVVFCLL